MSTTLPASAVDIDDIAHGIVQSSPGLSFREVRDAVEEVSARYAQATVVDFLPVLIEREVRARLRR